VGSADEAKNVIGKIVAYEGQSTDGPWTRRALMVADQNDTENFSQDSLAVQAYLPSTFQVTDVFMSTVGSVAARQDILAAITPASCCELYRHARKNSGRAKICLTLRRWRH